MLEYSGRPMETRQRIVQIVGSVVNDARDLVDRHAVPEPELASVMMFYHLADNLWVAAVSAGRPLNPASLVTGLRQLRTRCSGVLAPFAPRLDEALAEAQALEWEYRIA